MGRDKTNDRDLRSGDENGRSFQVRITEDGETRVVTLNGRPGEYVFDLDDDRLEIEARGRDFEWELDGIENFEILPASDPDEDGTTAFEVRIIEDDGTRVVTLDGRPTDYEFDLDGDTLEIEARDRDFEWELDDVQGFEILPLTGDDSTPAPGTAKRLDGPLRDYDFLLLDGVPVARSRIDGETEPLAGFDRVVAGGETVRIVDIVSLLERPGADLLAEGGPRLMIVNTPDPTPSVIWDQILQSIIVETGGGPTNAARSFAIVHTAIYDAHASYDAVAQRVALDLEGDNSDPADLAGASVGEVEAAMHIAAHHALSTLYPDHADRFDRVLSERLGIEGDDDSRAHEIGVDAAEDVLTPRVAEAAMLAALSEGLYAPVNPDPDTRSDMTRWTPEKQGVLSPTPDALQSFLTPELGHAEGFALPQTPSGETDTLLTRPDGPEPFFIAEQGGAVLNFDAGTITLAAPTEINGRAWQAGDTIPVDKSLIGPVINPVFIAQTEALVGISAALTADQKLTAEFWEDGPGTSFPPGAWMTVAQYVSQRDGHDAGTDAQLFMTMGNAMLDAAIATWDAKVHFDYARPVTVIRDLGKLGLIGEPGTDELTGETGYVIQAFGGIDPVTGVSLGTRTILAENFITYQLPGGELSPPFSEYTSGHSTFSAAGAAVLAAFTGSDHFGGEITVSPGTSAFDAALPAESYHFGWETFSQAAADGGASRIYGGIHFSDANVDGLLMGEMIGADAHALAVEFATGNALPEQQPFFEDFLFV